MEIPGLASFNGQPTVTNPLPQASELQGQKTSVQQQSETKNTQTISEQEATNLSATQVVEQANKSSSTRFERENIGSNIDITI